MEQIHLRDYARLFSLGNTVTALGFFDGVHLGHQALIDYTVSRARELGCASAVLTFVDDANGIKPSTPRITDQATRLSLLAERGVDYIILAPFGDVKHMTPMTFVKNVLIGLCHTQEAVCGFNFRFGQNRAGDANTLTQYLQMLGATTHIVPPTKANDGQVISSTAIREALVSGDVERAHSYMGRPYTLTAPVLHGQALGRTIGAPTMNQAFPPNAIVPKHGVYATQCTLDGVSYVAVTNVGNRPTVGGASVNCESHVLGFGGSLYGKTISLSFLSYIREEQHFQSVEALQAQIQKDIGKVETLYGIH